MFRNHLAGIYEKALPPELSWRERLEAAKELGFDFVEISIDESDERLSRLDWSREQMEQLHRDCYETGMLIPSMCLSAHRRFPFGSADPMVRREAHEIMEKAIAFASNVGIRVIQLAGYDVYYEPSTPQSIRLFREGMAWAAQKAASRQVMLAMEIMDTPFMNSITKHLGYEAMIHSPWYKVYPDLGNLSAWGENDPAEELARGIDSIVAIRVEDTLAVTDTFPGKFKCVPFGEGCVDFPARFGQLERLGYQGPYMIEMWYQPHSDWKAEITSAAQWLEQQFQIGISQKLEG